MSRIWLIARREMFAYMRSPLGSAITAAALLVDGIWFYWFGLSQRLVSAEVLAQFIYVCSGTTAIAGLLLSMRLLAEERQTGTITLLNTAPLRDTDIVLGKFLSAVAVILVMTALTAYMPALIFVNGKVSLGHIAVGYLGIILIGCATTAIGIFGSALAKSQIIAIIISAAIVAPLYLLWMIARTVDPPLNSFLADLAIHHENFRPFMLGTLRLQSVAYYVAVSFFFLLAAVKTLEARRWR